VLIVAPGEDTGGVGIGIVSAFRKHAPDWDVRFVRRTNNYINYPADIEWLADGDAVEKHVLELNEQADVIHFFLKCVPLPGWDTKGIVLHHHGTAFRRNALSLLKWAEDHRAISIASTMDLVALAPDTVTWLPNPYDLELMASYRVGYVPSSVLRISHAPTSRNVKGTSDFTEAFALFRQVVPSALDVIERVTWTECLVRKAKSDLYYDQALLGYGNNAIEAWAMGIPVMAGVEPGLAALVGHPIPESTVSLMERKFGELPFMRVRRNDFLGALRQMVDRNTREEFAERGLAHVRRWHDGKVVVEQLKQIYERSVA
jgi:glycosyltransferase involved in cell wall biosynthesis